MGAPMKPEFWLLDPPKDQELLKRADSPELKKTPCPASDSHSARLRRVGNLHVVADPLAERDFTWTWRNDMLISQKVLETLKKYKVTGFEVRPVVAAYPKPIKARPPEFHEVIITGWAGLPARAAGLSVTESCQGCGRKKYTIADPSRLIDSDTWDGSDLFIVWPLPRFPFASDRLANIIREENLSGVRMIPAAAIKLQAGTGIAPGSLFEWMPERRASELSMQFGIR